jgi:N-acylglucosamine 2-epimerase
VLGLAKHAALCGDRSAAQFALRLHGSVAQRLSSGTYNTEPYPVPPGYTQHGLPMIMLNTTQELAAALETLGMAEAKATSLAADGYMRQTLAYVDPAGTQHEYMTTQGTFDTDSLLGRHTNPGHTIEDMWFAMHQARGRSDAAARQVIADAAGAAQRAFALGWDAEYGGLLHFADQDGGAPRGSVAGMESVRVVQQVTSGWSDKLWWVHSEALYTTLLALRLTGDQSFVALYRQVRDYTFRTFPNPDRAVGEWIQIRDRKGEAAQKVVALPVKDPFHIMRNVALIIELLASWEE